jgi:UMF1 family MFS transporter
LLVQNIDLGLLGTSLNHFFIVNTTPFEKNNPRILFAWASYDWANSVYNLAITVSIFPAFYKEVTRIAYGTAKDGRTIVDFFGMEFDSGILYSYAISLSYLLAAILSPLLSGVADYGGKKKILMQFFTYLGASACFALFFFDGHNLELGIIAAIIASMGYGGSVVFYNSYLPEIATEDRWDRLSARGFSMGFLGSSIHLIVSAFIITNALSLGLTEIFAPRISFLLVAIWWVSFAQIAFYYLPKPTPKHTGETKLFAKGFAELNKVWQSLKDLPNVKRFLAAFFCYSMGAQTILLLATLFGSEVIGMTTAELIFTTLLLQFVGIIGAYLIAFLSEKIGNKYALIGLVVVWTGICIAGYFIYTKNDFYILASAVGVVMGAVHLSRSTYAKLLPENTPDTTSYFSFYDVTEKMSIVFGTFIFGLLAAIFDDMRASIVALSVFFLLGLFILFTVKIPRQA